MGGAPGRRGVHEATKEMALVCLLQQRGIVLCSLALQKWIFQTLSKVISETEVDGSAERQRKEILVIKLLVHAKGVGGYWAPREAANHPSLVLSPGCPQLQCSENLWASYPCFGPKAQEKRGIAEKTLMLGPWSHRKLHKAKNFPSIFSKIKGREDGDTSGFMVGSNNFYTQKGNLITF